MLLELSDAAFSERLAAFLTSLDQRSTVRGPGVFELDRDLDDMELAIYLRVWEVLYPEATVVVSLRVWAAPGRGRLRRVSEPSSAGGDEAAPDRIEEADSQRYLEHEDPEAERDRAGLGGESGAPAEPLPDERRDER